MAFSWLTVNTGSTTSGAVGGSGAADSCTGAAGSLPSVCGASVSEPRDAPIPSNSIPPTTIAAILPLDRFAFGGSVEGGAGSSSGGAGFGGGASVVLNVSSLPSRDRGALWGPD